MTVVTYAHRPQPAKRGKKARDAAITRPAVVASRRRKPPTEPEIDPQKAEKMRGLTRLSLLVPWNCPRG
jgi:hypothetical protein